MDLYNKRNLPSCIHYKFPFLSARFSFNLPSENSQDPKPFCQDAHTILTKKGDVSVSANKKSLGMRSRCVPVFKCFSQTIQNESGENISPTWISFSRIQKACDVLFDSFWSKLKYALHSCNETYIILLLFELFRKTPQKRNWKRMLWYIVEQLKIASIP